MKMKDFLSPEEVKALKPEQVHSVVSKTMLADGFDMVYDLPQSHGAYLYDALNKKWYLDFFSFFASMPISHNHPKMQEPSFVEKICTIARTKPSNSDVYTVEMAQFVATFDRVLNTSDFKHLFFISGGALAVENALKTAFDWKTQLLGKNDELNLKVIHFKDAFHGRSGYTLSLTNTSDPRKYRYFTKFDWPRFINPKLRFPVTQQVLEEVKRQEQQAIEEIEILLKDRGEECAAIIIEPIQGEGGDNHFRGAFLKELRTLADRYDVMLIFDEIQSGCGLTGKRWAYEHFDVVPDIVAFGKKTQVCGIMVSSKVDRVKDNVFKVSSRINSTWGGNLTDMVRAQRYLEIIEEDNLIDNAGRMGDYLLSRLKELSEEYSFISNVRGRGLMVAYDLPNGIQRDEFKKLLWEEGLLILPCGAQSIRFRPFLDVSKDDIDRAMGILDKVCHKFKKRYK